jgi:hypothetical protein
VAWTQSDADTLRAAIQAAIADGTWRVQQVAFPDSGTVTLNSLEDAMKLLNQIESAVKSAAGMSTRYVVSSKGV